MLKSIKTTSCPTCNCDQVIKEEVEITGIFGAPWNRGVFTHVNGHRWETRQFLCGTTIKYIPNFSGEEFYGKCSYTPEYKHEYEIIRLKTEKLRELELELQLLKYGK